MSRSCVHVHVFFTCLSAFMIIGCYAQDNLNGPTPSALTIQTGTTHKLECSLKEGGSIGTIVWNEDLEGGGSEAIYLGDAKTDVVKYTNFNLDTDGSTYWNLMIENVEAEDGGNYTCEDFGKESRSATRTVEAPPTSFTMTRDGSDVTAITAEEGETMEIVCTSVGSRPEVDIWWYQRREGEDFVRITDGITQDAVTNPVDRARFDTTSTIKYPANKDFNGGELRCVTNGQTIVDPVDDTASLTINYNPVVSLTYGSDTVTCSSDANPAVPEPNGYTIIVYNDTISDTYTPTKCENGDCTLTLKVEMEINVRCNATNAVGTGTKTIVAVPGAVIPTTPEPTTKKTGGGDGGPNVAAIVGGVFAVVFIIIVVVIIVLVVKKKKNDAKKSPKTSQSSEMTTRANGSGSDKPNKPTPAPRNSKADAHENEEGKKVKSNDNPDGILYAQLDLNNQNKSESRNSGKNIIRTDEPTEYADVKTFIQSPSSSTPPSSPTS